jgi:hypothetical protein
MTTKTLYEWACPKCRERVPELVDLLMVATERGLDLEREENYLFPLHDNELTERFGEGYLSSLYKERGVWHADDTVIAAGNIEPLTGEVRLHHVGDPCDGGLT